MLVAMAAPKGPAAGSPALTRLTVRAKPRASRSRIVKVDGLSLEAALAAPPVDGAANAALLELLSDALGVPKRALRLVVGEGSRNKVVEVSGLAPEEAQRRLSQA
jgi:uncharacterized protein YggU (UPF0235/DUF167 family)